MLQEQASRSLQTVVMSKIRRFRTEGVLACRVSRTLCAGMQASVAAPQAALVGQLDPATLQHAAKVLSGQNESIASLQEYVDRVERDIAIVMEAARGPDTLVVSTQ